MNVGQAATDGTPPYPVGVGILAFNRPHYLREALSALVRQEGAEPFPVVVLDNGSDSALEPEIADVLAKLSGPVTLVREARNALSPRRFAQLISAVDSEFVLLPGDDDVANSNYVRTAQGLIAANSGLSIFSSGMGQIDARGRRLATTNPPPQFLDSQSALASLINRASYCMPVTGVRKSVLDLDSLPLTRTAFDWWLWLQAWVAGTAAVSESETLLYRQHLGQEQRLYGTHAFRNDAARMLMDFVYGESFGSVLGSWSDAEVERFGQVLLSSDGPNSGDSRWGPLVQMSLVDRLEGRASGDLVCRLFAQANGQAGTPLALGGLRTLVPEIQLAALPPETWSRVPIRMLWLGSCPLVDEWNRYLSVQSAARPQFEVTAACSCDNGSGEVHCLVFTGRRFQGAEQFEVQIDGPPSDKRAASLLDALGRMTGRLHGFETHLSDEVLVLASYRRFRLSRVGVAVERVLRILAQWRKSGQ